MEAAPSYEVKLDVFQGPMDLLLFLIRKKKIDIHDIPIAVITREYLHYLERKDKINLNREGEFLVTAALLIYIKSRMLLPRENVAEEGEDPRSILVDTILEHQRIKAACSMLRKHEENELKKWHRTAPPPLPQGENEDTGHGEVSLFDLAEAFFTLMQRREREDVHVITGKDFSIEEKMAEITGLVREKGHLDFHAYFWSRTSLNEALVSFFCLLELVRSRIVVAVQDNIFAPIKVWLRSKETP